MKTTDYWSYRESLEKSGHILWLPMMEQARFVDGIAAQYSDNTKFCLGQLHQCQSENESDFKEYNASAIGTVAFLSLFGPEDQREAWRAFHLRIISALKKDFNVSAEKQHELERSTVDHPSFPPITEQTVAEVRARSSSQMK